MKKRINLLSRALKNKNIDSLIINDPANIKYLTRADQGCILFTVNKEIVFFTSPIYLKTISKTPGLKVVAVKDDLSDKIAKEAKKLKLKRIGFQREKVNLAFYQKISEKLRAKNIELIETRPLIENLRKIKSKQEIKLIKKAALASLEAFDYILDIYNQATTEKDLSIEIERFLKLKSDNKTAFPSIVASGKNTLFAHHEPGENKINNFFLIDLGARHCGYCADLTRVFFSGRMPPHFRKIYNTVKKAQDAAINKIKEGVKASEVDKAARNIVDKNGFAKYFLHGLGHGVGLRVHELPYLKPDSAEILKEGMVLAVEPAIYYKNQFGGRIEAMVVVKSKNREVIS